MKEQNSAIWPTSPRTSLRQLDQGGSVWVRILFEGYYWKSEAKMKERRKTNEEVERSIFKHRMKQPTSYHLGSSNLFQGGSDRTYLFTQSGRRF